jgi:hypothetical protein
LSATDLGAADLTATDVGAMDVTSTAATSSQMVTEPPPALFSADQTAPMP